MKITRRTLLRGLIGSTALGVVETAKASEAEAVTQTTGGVVINSYQSEGNIYITSQRPMVSYTSLPAGKRSDKWGMKNVQGFKVPSGYVAINVNTGYKYAGGQWWYMSRDNLELLLRVDWLGNN